MQKHKTAAELAIRQETQRHRSKKPKIISQQTDFKSADSGTEKSGQKNYP
jgi:hypothetical protein